MILHYLNRSDKIFLYAKFLIQILTKNMNYFETVHAPEQPDTNPETGENKWTNEKINQGQLYNLAANLLEFNGVRGDLKLCWALIRKNYRNPAELLNTVEAAIESDSLLREDANKEEIKKELDSLRNKD